MKKILNAIIKGFEKYAKAIAFMGLLGLISMQVACTHMTPYQACNEQQGDQIAWQKYGSLQECMSEVKQAAYRRYQAKQQMAHAFDGLGQRTNLTCTPNGFGGYRCQ